MSRARRQRLPLLDRVAAPLPDRPGAARAARPRPLRPPHRRAARARDRAGRDALPLGAPAGARGRGRLAEPRHGRALRRVRSDLLRGLRRPGPLLADDQRAVDHRPARLPARPPRARLQGRRPRRGDRLPPPAPRARPAPSQEFRARRAATAASALAPNLSPHYPASDDPADARRRRASDGYVNRWFLDPVFRGSYPDDMRRRYEGARRPARLRPRRRPRDDRARRPTTSASTTTRRRVIRGRPGRHAVAVGGDRPRGRARRPAASPTASRAPTPARRSCRRPSPTCSSGCATTTATCRS